MTTVAKLKRKCPHCGWVYDPWDGQWKGQAPLVKVPTHDFPKPCRAVCRGAGGLPRLVDDTRPLGKDAG